MIGLAFAIGPLVGGVLVEMSGRAGHLPVTLFLVVFAVLRGNPWLGSRPCSGCLTAGAALFVGFAAVERASRAPDCWIFLVAVVVNSSAAAAAALLVRQDRPVGGPRRDAGCDLMR